MGFQFPQNVSLARLLILFINNLLEFGYVVSADKDIFIKAVNGNYKDLEDGIQIEAARAEDEVADDAYRSIHDCYSARYHL